MRATLLLAGLIMAGTASAQNMPLKTLLDKGAALQKKGPLALFSRGEIKVLQSEIQATGPVLRAERMAAAKAGKKPAFCPPSQGQKMGAQQLLADLRAVAPSLPPTATVTDGMRAVLAKKYPCPA